MKNIKVFKVLLVIIFISSILQGCNEENQINQEKNITPEILSKNKSFKNISKEMSDYTIFIKETIENHKLSAAELIPKINAIVNSNLSSNEQLLKLNELLNVNISERVKKNAELIGVNWKILKNEFKIIDDETLQKAFEINILENNQYSPKIMSCPWRYNLCLVAAYSGAVLCHAGCDTTALATTAGLGIPVCVALCGSLQVFASVQCYDSYCNN
jgi:hypothetical protein